MMPSFATVFAALLFASAASATPVMKPVEDVVFSPTVTSPDASAIWTIGSTQVVTWDTSAIPPEGQNQTGLLLLGYQTDDSGSENLDINHPLATQFPISAGTVNVTVPVVDPRTDYIVVLFGDSGNKSPQFTITTV